jgi:hypothetical protein
VPISFGLMERGKIEMKNREMGNKELILKREHMTVLTVEQLKI